MATVIHSEFLFDDPFSLVDTLNNNNKRGRSFLVIPSKVPKDLPDARSIIRISIKWHV